MTDARQPPLSTPAPHSLFLVAVRCGRRPSHVQTFADMETMRQAATEWLWKRDVAWVSYNTMGGKTYPPKQTHICVRRGEEIIVREQAGRLDRVRRATGQSSRGMAAPV